MICKESTAELKINSNFCGEELDSISALWDLLFDEETSHVRYLPDADNNDKEDLKSDC